MSVDKSHGSVYINTQGPVLRGSPGGADMVIGEAEGARFGRACIRTARWRLYSVLLEVSNELLIIAARRCTFKVVKKSLLSMSDEEAG